MIKKGVHYFLGLAFLFSFEIYSQKSGRFNEIAQKVEFDNNNRLVYVQLRPDYIVYENNAEAFLNNFLSANNEVKAKKENSKTDELGYTHSKYSLSYKNVLIENKIIIVHAFGGKIISVNGDIEGFQMPLNTVSISEKTAFEKALKKVNAKKYKWENKEEENYMKQIFNNPLFSYYPSAELVLFNPVSGENKQTAPSYTYRFDIFAEEPLSKSNVYVDAQSGNILAEVSLLCSADVTATANTRYSGTQTITTDNYGTNLYRLRETARGNGIETYDMKNLTTYSTAVDFTNTATTWTTTSLSQVATDAHWGAEMTYDYLLSAHNRNSIDDAGHKLVSFVHYGSNYNNAFWNGTVMTYGDGDGSLFTPLTSIDVCGHEIAHGLTSKTSGLIYSYESGALNESYSDIIGALVENYGRPSNWNWIVGEDMTPNGDGIRNMENPKLHGNPDTYLGQFWYTGSGDNGGVHINSGVSNHWFYLLSTGGSGTNDISNTYTVTSLGLVKAAQIAYRANAYYYTPTTNYLLARQLSIIAAADLFGNCSHEVEQTTNAWYAVGVGSVFTTSIIPNFTVSKTSYCSYPATVTFSNTTANGINFFWDFGDGNTTTSTTTVNTIVHTYTANGIYSVKLKATGCPTDPDSITKPSYININVPDPSVATGTIMCGPALANISASGSGQQYWYSVPSTTGTPLHIGNSYTTPAINNTTTYYVANTFTNTPVYGAATGTVIGTTMNSSSNIFYQVFDVFETCILKSVVVHASVAGNRVIQLRAPSQSTAAIYSTTVNLPVGVSTVTLNYVLHQGTNYQLGLSSTSLANLYSNNSGTSYPYNIGGLLNIHGSSSPNQNFYYYFYNWEVAKANCSGMPVPVTVTINPSPNVNLSISKDTLCVAGDSENLIGNPSGGIYSGIGVSGNSFNPGTGIGSYQVVYSVTGSNGCVGRDTLDIYVDACAGIKKHQLFGHEISIFPNPVNNEINLQSAEFENTETTLLITDVVGRLLFSKKYVVSGNRIKVDISELPAGTYFITVSNNLLSFTGKMIKQ